MNDPRWNIESPKWQVRRFDPQSAVGGIHSEWDTRENAIRTVHYLRSVHPGMYFIVVRVDYTQEDS